MTITDQYLLTQSKKFNIDQNEEVRIDLKLRKKHCQPNTKLTGKVYSTDHHPIPKATVKVLDEDYNPIVHALTKEDGSYIIENLKPGEYKLTATAPGFLVAPIICFSIRNNETKIINIELKEDICSQNNNVIYGTITELITNKAIENSEIKLFSFTSRLPIAETTSNETGQYLFSCIPPGEYFAVATKPGFITSPPIRFIASKGQFIKIPFQLQIDYSNSSSTISGLIKDFISEELANACVGLYRIEQDGETLIQIKMTNSEGLYLFSDVTPGEYVVKAKKQEKWESYKTFTINKAPVLY